MVAILGLALGANTAIVSLIDDIFLGSLPGERPWELTRVYGELPEKQVKVAPFSITKFEALRAQQTVFDGVAADASATFTLTGLSEPLELYGYRVTSNYFDVLGTRPELGRAFRPEEESTGEPVALISHTLWQSLLHGSADAVGRNLTLNGVPYTLIGVLPPQSRAWFGNADVWTTRPFDNPSYPRPLLERGVSFLRVVARTHPGDSLARVESALAGISAGYRTAYPENADAAWHIRVRTLEDDTVGALRPAFRTLLAAVGLVLLIAASNAANLMMVRFRSRERELAVRRALGASRGRVLRLLLFEGFFLGLSAGGVGVALASLLLRASPLLVAGGLTLAPRLILQWGVLAFGLILAAVCGLLAGLAPAVQVAGTMEVGELGQRGSGPGRGETRARSVLLAAQVGLSFALLVGALLLAKSFAGLLHAPVGFDASRVFIASVSLPPARYPDGAAQAQFAARWLERLRQAPGVEVAAVAQGLALTRHDRQSPYARTDRDVPPLKDRPLALVRSVTPGYFKALGIGLFAGRDFDPSDRADSTPTVILSRGAERTLFPEDDALGHHLLISSEGGGLDVEVVGVVGDVRSVSPETENLVEFYRPLVQRPSPYLQVAVLSSGELAGQAANLRATLREVDPQLPINNTMPMTELLAGALGQRRLTTVLIGAFAVLALVLAAVGIGGVVANLVDRRTTEIGIRLALGATQSTVRAMLIRDALGPVGWGIAAGLLALSGLAPLLRHQLYATHLWDPVVVAGSAVLLVAVALLAGWLPARRADRIDPAECLRGD